MHEALSMASCRISSSHLQSGKQSSDVVQGVILVLVLFARVVPIAIQILQAGVISLLPRLSRCNGILFRQLFSRGSNILIISTLIITLMLMTLPLRASLLP